MADKTSRIGEIIEVMLNTWDLRIHPAWAAVPPVC
jgi:hypothetical protein